MTAEDELWVLAATQHGLVSRHQAREAGLSREAVRARLASGRWEDVNGEVLRVAGTPRTTRQELMAAVLAGGPGTVVSHLSAAWLWEVPGFVVRSPDVTRWRNANRRPIPGARCHWSRSLGASHVTEIDGIPVTTLPRTLFDLAATERPARLERALATVCTRSPAVLPGLHRLLDELGRKGRAGVATMRQLLADYPVGSVTPASGLEARVIQILEDASEPPLERQVDVGGHDWIGRVDLADRAIGLLIEIDSAAHHGSALDRERDRRRDQALYAAGWQLVLRIPAEDVWNRPWDVVARIRAARRQLEAA